MSDHLGETLKVRLLRDGARMPTRGTPGSAGLDLCACLDEPVEIGYNALASIPVGIAVEIPPRHAGFVVPRSGLAAKQKITVLNAPGLVDPDYRGEVRVLLFNHDIIAQTIRHGDRVAQLVVVPVAQLEPVFAVELSETERGDGGFGSTGR